MPRLEPRPAHEVPEAARESGFFRTLAWNGRIADATWQHYEAVMGEGRVDRRLKELCAVLISALNQCEYCLVAHRAAAKRIGVEAEVLRALSDYETNPSYAEPERAALAAAVALTREPRALPEALWVRLRAAFDEAQIIEVLSTIALFNAFNRISNALDVAITSSASQA